MVAQPVPEPSVSQEGIRKRQRSLLEFWPQKNLALGDTRVTDGELPPAAETTGDGDGQRSDLGGANSPHMDDNAQQSVPVVDNGPHIDVSTQQSTAESDIVMSDGWKLRPASVPGGRLVSCNVEFSSFWNVR